MVNLYSWPFFTVFHNYIATFFCSDLDKVTKEIIQELKLKKKDGDAKNKDWLRLGNAQKFCVTCC